MCRCLPTFLLFLLFIGSVSSCDQLPDTPTQGLEYIELNHFRVEPTLVSFNALDDGFKDTTLIFQVFTQIHNSEWIDHFGMNIKYPRTSEILEQIPLPTPTPDNLPIDFSTTFSWQTNTINFEEFVLELYALDVFGYGISHQATIQIDGIASDPPVILWAENPSPVEIPTDDTTVNIPFKAKVTDPDGQNTIDRVFILFENEDGSLLVPTPNILTDTGLGLDEAAGDSVYTITFSINKSNTAQNRTVLYYALDKAGLSSDTVRTSFNLIEP
jgi:hypothetical protein